MIEIRDAQRNDAPRMGALYVDAWRETYAGLLPSQLLLRMSPGTNARIWRRQIAARGKASPVLVAVDADHGIVGLSSGGACQDPSLDAECEVWALYVDPNHLGQGVGRALLAGMFDRFAKGGCSSAVIWALARNPGRHFYERAGGRPIARRLDRIWGARLEVVAYGWSDLAEARTRLSPAAAA